MHSLKKKQPKNRVINRPYPSPSKEITFYSSK